MRLVILGSGGYGRMIADVAAQLNKYDEILFLDDHSAAEDVVGKCGECLDYIDHETEIYPAFGRNDLRMEWLERVQEAGGKLPLLIHPTAYVSPTAEIAEGTVILPNAVVNSYTKIEKGCIINSGALIDHNCVLEEGTHICLGAVIKADNILPANIKIEAGAVIENRTYTEKRKEK